MKKEFRRSLNEFLQNVSPNLEQFTQAVKTIEVLCQNRASVEIKICQGAKLCYFCELNNAQSVNQEFHTQDLIKCKECLQYYHQQCLQLHLERGTFEQKDYIQQLQNYEEANNYEVVLNINCLKCNSSKGFPSEVYEWFFEYKKELDRFLSARVDDIYANIVQYKKQTSSCQKCNFLWLIKQGDHQIFDENIEDNRNFKQTIEEEREGKKVILKKFFRVERCKHIFCQECLTSRVMRNQILQDNYDLTCQVPGCGAPLTYKEISQLLNSKFNWLIKYKHQKFLIEVLQQYVNFIQFVQCRGIYKLDLQVCGAGKAEKREDIIKCIKEVEAMEDDIEEQGLQINPNLKNINSIQVKANEKLVSCRRVYQVNRTKDFDMTTIFADILANTEDEAEKKERENLYKQYQESTILPFYENPENNNASGFQLKCQDDDCQFDFCVNGCYDLHQNGQGCPNANLQFYQTKFNVGLERVVKDIGKNLLYRVSADNTVALSNNTICYKCFRDLKLNNEAEKNKDGELPFLKCPCRVEYASLKYDEDYAGEIIVEEQDNNESENEDEGEEVKVKIIAQKVVKKEEKKVEPKKEGEDWDGEGDLFDF